MPQSECIKVHLKPGMTNKFLEWAEQVPNRMEEAKLCMSEQESSQNTSFWTGLRAGTSLLFIGKQRIWQRPGPCFKAPRERWIWR
jgi:hypothetical protein